MNDLVNMVEQEHNTYRALVVIVPMSHFRIVRVVAVVVVSPVIPVTSKKQVLSIETVLTC